MNEMTPCLTEENAREAAERFIADMPPCPTGLEGRGIVICGGGRYFTSAYIGIRLLRHLGCRLPIQLWFLGSAEMDQNMKALLTPLGVECVDAYEVEKRHPARILKGWELKAYAIVYSPFREVLLMDADNLAVVDPEFLFDTPAYLQTGAIFWPDRGRIPREHAIWGLCGIAYQDEPEFESGQIVVDKERCWEPMRLALWYNEQSDFFYGQVYGDKETFHLAFRKLDHRYSMPHEHADFIEPVFYQYDFDGDLVFQHRKKWDFFRDEEGIDLVYAPECCAFLRDLRRQWDGRVHGINRFHGSVRSPAQRRLAGALTSTVFLYERIGYDCRSIAFRPDGVIGTGQMACEVYWDLIETQGTILLEISSATSVTCRLAPETGNTWRGEWVHSEKMPVRLSPRPVPGETDLRLDLLNVTLVAVDSTNVDRTVRAMQRSLRQARFKSAFLFSDARVEMPPEIRRVPVPRMVSPRERAEFMLRDLPVYRDMFADFILTVHVNGFILAPDAWRSEFLHFDYVGPVHKDGSLGNGAFSLRSRRLLEALERLRAHIAPACPEHEAFEERCLERLAAEGILFAPKDLADQFCVQDAPYANSFGYCGLQTEQRSGFSLESLDAQDSGFTLEELFFRAKYSPSADQPHVETLRRIAAGCSHITQIHVGDGKASAALLYARPDALVAYDAHKHVDIGAIENAARSAGLPFEFKSAYPAEMEIEPTDLLYFGSGLDCSLRQSLLAHHADKARRAIVVHGTSAFAEAPAQTSESEIEGFLHDHPEWRLAETHGQNQEIAVMMRCVLNA